ncbi:winged helix DNA-binding domain-containing protein [Amycolatopsis australiensis]|uniref:Winged helix DNA-binding domain-containing protein n=1 Tax=Amycolatopsis australiensis TaxID=546364 RepID=A0A1K1T5V2_9PSEU|nr:winged helix DNA-binding domain-containing protein [Amycolatopsis australiensis]SFW91908.1 Winged helix DNA-binding domain-containing protein [Amycolatopsis australiensis]
METLSRRALNRATLERQLLLRRVKMSAYDAVEHLAGLQAQAPFPPYYALWARLSGFRPPELASLLENRRVVRIALMRGTVHLVTAADALAWRPVVQPLYDRDLKTNTQHAGEVAELDHDLAAKAARELLARSPLSSTALGTELAQRWPDVAPASLTHLARAKLPLVQTPPRAIWGKAGQTTYACLDEWVGAPLSPPAPASLIARYLRAFGPASVADVQAWAGITRLGEVAASMELRRYRDPDGRELIDLPELSIPDEDIPAPPRLLGPFDQMILSYADRTRVISDEYRKRVISQNGLVKGTLLVGGQVRGFWELKSARKAAVVELAPFEKLPKRDLAALESAAGRLAGWAEPAAETREVRVHAPE